MRQWELARITIRAGGDLNCMWMAPEPIMVLGLRFSQPMTVREVHLGLECIATDNRALVERYPEYRLNLLERAYTEWRPTIAPSYELRVGMLLSVVLAAASPEGSWVELLHEFPEDRAARLKRAMRREQAGGRLPEVVVGASGAAA